jgi:hypothetical protein
MTNDSSFLAPTNFSENFNERNLDWTGIQCHSRLTRLRVLGGVFPSDPARRIDHPTVRNSPGMILLALAEQLSDAIFG